MNQMGYGEIWDLNYCLEIAVQVLYCARNAGMSHVLKWTRGIGGANSESRKITAESQYHAITPPPGNKTKDAFSE